MVWFPLVFRESRFSPATPASFAPAIPEQGSRVPHAAGGAIMEVRR